MSRYAALIRKALEAEKEAHVPYSHFRVGAAILGKDGQVFTGCNVESSSFSLTLCAERVALFKAISEGVREFTAIAIVSSSREIVPPCGACRQVLWDLAGDIDIVVAKSEDDDRIFRLSELLPHPFNEGLFIS